MPLDFVSGKITAVYRILERIRNMVIETTISLAASTEDDVDNAPGDVADPKELVEANIPDDILSKYEIYSYRNAALILNQARSCEFKELLDALRNFSLTTDMIKRAGGNESEIPKIFSRSLRGKGWYETIVQADLLVTKSWKQSERNNKGKFITVKKNETIKRAKYIDGHKIDYIKGRVAFDLEWNSKDQTFDRDLYAFSAFSQCGAIDVGILVTRSASLNAVFAKLGPDVKKKYGASTTWMGKLLYRLNAGRNGSCPVLVIGITPKCISDGEGNHAK